MGKVKISVIVPVYNTIKYLKQCIDSLLSQTLGDFEVICVDDGSTDGSLELLREYEKSDERIKVLQHENDGCGAANARNMGIKEAKGEYLIFLDSDDFFHEQLLEKTYKRATEVSADIVIYDAVVYDEISGEYNYNYKGLLFKEHIPDKEVFSYKDVENNLLFQIKSGEAWTMLVKRKLVTDNNLYFYPVYWCDDVFFTYTAMASAKRITFLDERLIYYRKNVGESQNDRLDRSPLSVSKAYTKLKKWLIEHALNEKLGTSLYNDAIFVFQVFLDKIKNYDSFAMAYNEIRNNTLKTLEADRYSESDYVKQDDYIWYREIRDRELDEYLFKKYKNSSQNIGRFAFPYEKVKRGSNIILYGAGEVGKAYFSQILTNPWCSVSAWIDREGSKKGFCVEPVEAIKEKVYDAILIANEDERIREKIKDSFVGLGIKESKIIV